MKAAGRVKSVENKVPLTELAEKAQADSLILLSMDKSPGHHILTSVSIFCNTTLFKTDWMFRGIIYKVR